MAIDLSEKNNHDIRKTVEYNDEDFSNYNVAGDDTTISSNIPKALEKEYEKFSNIIEHIQSLSEREQWKAIFRIENALKEEYPIDSLKKHFCKKVKNFERR